MLGPTIVAFGTDAAEATLPPRHPRRRRDLVPGLQRARRRLRPCLRAHDRRARRRRVGDRRPEGVDHLRTPRRLDLRVVPHRSRARPSTRASRCCSCRWTSPGSRCVRSVNIAGASASSARCSSTAPARRPTSSSAPSTRAGRSRSATLGFERGTATLPHQMQFEREVDDLIELARVRGAHDAIRSCASASSTRWIGVRILALQQRPQAGGARRWRRHARPRGVDRQGLLVRVAPAALRAEARRARRRRASCTATTSGSPRGCSARSCCRRAETIYGGANQIQRNTLGERVLGLPREPR